MTLNELLEKKLRTPIVAATTGLMIALGYDCASVSHPARLLDPVAIHEPAPQPAQPPRKPHTKPAHPATKPIAHPEPVPLAPAPVPAPSAAPIAIAPGKTEYFGKVPFTTIEEATAYTRKAVDSLYKEVNKRQLAVIGLKRETLPPVIVEKGYDLRTLATYSNAEGDIRIVVGVKGNDEAWLDRRKDMLASDYVEELKGTLAHELGHDLAMERANELEALTYIMGTFMESNERHAFKITAEGIANWYQAKTYPDGDRANRPTNDDDLKYCAQPKLRDRCEEHEAGWAFVKPIADKGGQAAIDYLIEHPVRAKDLDHLVAKRDSIMAKF